VKKILGAVLIFFAAAAFAGDVASFDDIGFSSDGKIYIFGQYGKYDRTYEPWAEIFTVDVAENDFVKGEIFRTKAGEVSADISGKAAYENLKASSSWKLAKYGAKPSTSETLLYLRESETKSPTDEIVFKDFEGSSSSAEIFYHVRLVPEFEGSGKNCRSKFFIDVTKKDSAGNLVTSFKVGTPDFRRKGITGYQIEKIFTDKSGKSLLFVVRKTLEDDAGTSIRYMVEAIRIK
jgi:predicted secreted protein